MNNQNGHDDNTNRQNEQLIQSVHNKVRNYILRQIDIQISELDMEDTCVQDSKVGGEMNSNPVVRIPSSSGSSEKMRKQPQTGVKTLEPANDSDVTTSVTEGEVAGVKLV